MMIGKVELAMNDLQDSVTSSLTVVLSSNDRFGRKKGVFNDSALNKIAQK